MSHTPWKIEHGVALNEDGKEQGGMGLAVADFVNNDGFLDIFKTYFSDDTHILYKNNGKDSFRDVTTRAGLAVETRFVGWAPLSRISTTTVFLTSCYALRTFRAKPIKNKPPPSNAKDIGSGIAVAIAVVARVALLAV